MHLCGRSNLRGSCIDSKNERENDRKQDRCVGAINEYVSPGHYTVPAHGQLTSRKVVLLACHPRRRRWQHQEG